MMSGTKMIAIVLLILPILSLTQVGAQADDSVIPTELSAVEMTRLSKIARKLSNEAGVETVPFGMDVVVWPNLKNTWTCTINFLYMDDSRNIHIVHYCNKPESIFYQGKPLQWWGVGTCRGNNAILDAINSLENCRKLVRYVYEIEKKEDATKKADSADLNYRIDFSPSSECKWSIEMGYSAERSLRFRIDNSGTISKVH